MMGQTHFGGRIVRLSSADTSQVVGVFCDAFRDYPVMRHIIGEAGGEYEERLRILIGFFVMARALSGEPLIGIAQDGNLMAAATVSFPGRGEAPAEIESLRLGVWERLGAEARTRYEACGAAWQGLEVAVPHLHLNMIGVRHSEQGKGLAGRLLQHIHGLSRDSVYSEGVTLTTEDARNVPLYRKAGYEIVGHAQIAPKLETWGFFRRD